MTEGTPTNNVYKKLFAVMQDLKGIEKTGFNQNQKYKFVSSEYLLSVVREHFIAQGLVFIPSMTIAHINENQVTTVEMNFRIVDTESGDEIYCPWMGQGWDKFDKGIYKAVTGATKYFLMKLLLLGEPGDDAEFDGGQQPPREGGREQKKNPFDNAPAQKAPAPAPAAEDPWRPADGIPKPIGAGDTSAPPLILHPMDMEGTTRSIQKRVEYYTQSLGEIAGEDADEEELETLFAAVAGIMPELAEDWQKQGEMLQDVARHLWGDWALTVARVKSLVFHMLEVTGDGELARDKEDNLVLREYAPEVLRELYLSSVSGE